MGVLGGGIYSHREKYQIKKSKKKFDDSDRFRL